jgi:hypothetical protein
VKPAKRHITATWVEFLEQVDSWLPADVERVDALVDNLGNHRTPEVLLFALAGISGPTL